MIEFHAAQGSREWHDERRGIVTGTSLKEAVGSEKVQNTLMYRLLAEKQTEPDGGDLNHVEAIAWGNRIEPMAINKASEKLGIEFELIGMLLSTEIKGFGCSPDAVYRDKNDIIIGGLECKAPGSKQHIRYLIEDKIPDDYRFQTLAPFLICDTVQTWYFCSYDPRCYINKIFIKRVDRDDIVDELEEIRKKLIKFLDHVREEWERLAF